MTEVEVFNLAELSRSFATRMKGKEVAGLVRDVIAKNNPGTIVVDWSGVSAASPSFIDEFIGGIQEAVCMASFRSSVAFMGNDSGIMTLVDTILRRREFPVRYTARPDDPNLGSVSMPGKPLGQRAVTF